MRFNHEDLPEILDAYKRGEHFFGQVKIVIDGNPIAFEFGVSPSGYRALRRVLQHRPFETTTAGAYRYYFIPSFRMLPEREFCEFYVRIEQGREGRQYPFRGPKTLVSNLMWFFELKDLNAASHLRQVSTGSEDLTNR